MRPPRLCLLAVSVCIAGLGRAASFDERVETLFRPPLGERMALSPDGLRIAYTARAGSELAIAILNLENSAKRTVKLDLADASLTGERPAEPLRFLRWATPNRLVFAPAERVVPLPPIIDKAGHATPNPDGPTIISPILAMDADGQQRGTLVDARDFQETPADARRTLADLLRTTKEFAATQNAPVRWRMPHLEIVGFSPRDREQLIVRTRGAYSPPAHHLVDIRTASVREFGEWPAPPGEPHVFDWFRLKTVGERKAAARPTTAWHDEELGRMQRELEAKFPRRAVEILDWSETRARVLLRVTGGSDPGRVFVYQRPEDVVLEIFSCAPWLGAAKLNETRFFEFAARDGARLSGQLTWPKKPRVTPPPLLVIFPAGFPGCAQPAFDPEAQIFADMGFIVARLNHRGVAGPRPDDLPALRTAVDRVAADDARAALEWIAAQHPERPFDRRRVAVLGHGFGGYLAVRALQLQPATFCCGAAFDAPLELGPWLQTPQAAVPAALFGPAGAEAKSLSVLAQAETLANPLCLLVEPGRNPAVEIAAGELRARLQSLGRAPDYRELPAGFAAAEPAARAAAYRQLGEFFGQRLRGYDVTIGPMTEVK